MLVVLAVVDEACPSLSLRVDSVFVADDSRGISVRGLLLGSLVDLGGGLGAAETGDLGRVTMLAATTLAILTDPEEVKVEALKNPAAWSWEEGMKLVKRQAR